LHFFLWNWKMDFSKEEIKSKLGAFVQNQKLDFLLKMWILILRLEFFHRWLGFIWFLSVFGQICSSENNSDRKLFLFSLKKKRRSKFLVFKSFLKRKLFSGFFKQLCSKTLIFKGDISFFKILQWDLIKKKKLFPLL